MFSHRLIRSLLDYYTELADVQVPYHLTLSRVRFERVRKRRGYASPLTEADLGATLVGPPPLIWIDPRGHRELALLARTCAHEVWHVASPDAPHGQRFDAAVRALLKGREP